MSNEIIKKSAGRPRTSTNGEAKNKKLAIYLTSSLEADLKDLATIDNLTLPAFVAKLLETAAQNRADDITDLRKIRARSSLNKEASK